MAREDNAATVLAALGAAFSFTLDGITVTGTDGRVVGPVVAWTLDARDDRGTLPLDNPYAFAYPPLLVDDATVESPADAARRMIVDAVVGSAERAGWSR